MSSSINPPDEYCFNWFNGSEAMIKNVTVSSFFIVKINNNEEFSNLNFEQLEISTDTIQKEQKLSFNEKINELAQTLNRLSFNESMDEQQTTNLC